MYEFADEDQLYHNDTRFDLRQLADQTRRLAASKHSTTIFKPRDADSISTTIFKPRDVDSTPTTIFKPRDADSTPTTAPNLETQTLLRLQRQTSRRRLYSDYSAKPRDADSTPTTAPNLETHTLL
ncbi:uncharacterized protein LOC141914108 isoform X4 [Tubulanus polymorphus]|uniref:uncharacterized protein LOC141914108 isoform X4 n=1 Tax=Tubulanus polymorphus TaxID=672921 RepID=UPI003DA448D6